LHLPRSNLVLLPSVYTWYPLCYTALVFSRRVEGQAEPLTFGVSGKLLYNTLVMFDRQTDSLWSQLYGSAVDGPLTGQSLVVYPSLHTEWAAWQAQHPDTLVLSKRLTCEQFDCGTYATNPRGSYAVDPYASYYNTPLEGVVNHQIPRDERSLQVKQRVPGVRVAGQARAYPYRVLADQPVINDVINGELVLVWFDLETQTGVAYVRRVGERILSFSAEPHNSGLLVDAETGSSWRAATGAAIAGRLRGEQLPGLIVTPTFESGWYDYFPDSDTYTPKG
jgi:hypothetical protein